MIRAILFFATLCVFIACSAYAGITRDLCRRIDTFTTAEQAAMKLTPDNCKGY